MRPPEDLPADPGHLSAWQLIHANRRSYDNPIPLPHSFADHVDTLEAALVASRTEIAALRASTSWRLTGGLRWLTRKIQSRPPEPTTTPPPVGDPPWSSRKEPRHDTSRNRPERGSGAVRQQRLGLVLLGGAATRPDAASLSGCPASCAVLSLDEATPGGEVIALAMAKLDADLLCFLDAKDQLAPDALTVVADLLARQPRLDLVFADEDWLDADGQGARPFLKPGWDAELQRGRDLIGPFAFLRADLARAARVSGPAWRYDLASQVAAMTRPERIHHIPAVLCHRAAASPGQDAARQEAVAAQLRRQGIAAQVVPAPGHPDWRRVIYDLPDPAPLVSVIVPTRDHAELLRACADGILRHTSYQRLELLIVDNGSTEAGALALLETLAQDPRVRVLREAGPFNWSALNNVAAAQARGEILLLLNNDIAVRQPGWLTEMASRAIQPGVGAVGAKLLYPDGRVQHAGLTTDRSGLPRHLLRFAPGDDAGPFGLLGLAREVWGVTGACLAIRRELFHAVGGLNEALPIGCNDVDLCLHLRAAGYRIIWTPWAVLEHRESVTRGADTTPEQHARTRAELDRLSRDWGSLVTDDPYSHPALDAADQQPSPVAEPRIATVSANPAAVPDQSTPVVAAQARRDRARLVAAQAESAALCQQVLELGRRVATLERSPSRRAAAPARAALSLARRLLARRQAPAPAASADPPSLGRGLALVIDHDWPRPDRDSGSVDIVNLARALDHLGFHTILAASRQHDGEQPARDLLSAQGVRCLRASDAASVEDFIRQRGATLALCVMCRVFCGGEFLEILQSHARQARLIFNSIDLNYLREERKARLFGDEALLAKVGRLRQREEHIIRNSDATLIVSELERLLLAETLPEAFTAQMPLARPVRSQVANFTERAGIGFIGGFAHAPNADAMRYFLAAIWPAIQSALPDSALSVVGADAPADLIANSTNVHLLGYQPDIAPWFEGLRVTVAPLRFGAGAKGKVASSLAHGVPCILTSVAAEGMFLANQGGVVVCDTPEEFAAATVRAITDETHWQLLSQAGLAYATRNLSLSAWEARLDMVVRQIGL